MKKPASTATLKEVIFQYHGYGLNAIPANPEDKRPIPKWKIHQDKPITIPQLERMTNRQFHGVGIVCGKGSRGLEVIDIDIKNDPTGTLWKDLSSALKSDMPEVFDKLVIETTPSGGYHLYYTCEILKETFEIAWEEAGAIIETRGSNGFIMSSPSPGYKLFQGDFSAIPKITPIEREWILKICKGYGTGKKIETSTGKNQPNHKEKNQTFVCYDKGHGFDETLKLLVGAKYKVVGTSTGKNSATKILRPGNPTSPYSGYIYPDTGNLLMFSTATEFKSEQYYSPAEVLAVIEFNGDFKAAETDLKGKGYDRYSGKDQLLYIEDYISNFLEIRCNSLINEYEWNGDPLTDADYNTIYLKIRKSYRKDNPKAGYNIVKQLIFDVIHSAFTEKYNPLQEFLDANQERQHCTGTISKLAATITTATKFINQDYNVSFVEFFLTKWLVNMIDTALRGTDNPLLLALLGKQNTGKTEFLRRLLPKELKRYFGEFAIADDKDFFIAMTKYMLIADDELSGKSRVETKALKKITSMQNVYVRRPYGRVQETLKRRCSFAGTGNDLKVLYDLTGNRRIIPFEVISIDHAAYNAIDKTDLIVEAYQLLVSGYNYRLSGKDVRALNDASSDFEFNEFEVELCQEYLMKPVVGRVIERRSATDIKNLFESAFKQRIDLVKLGKALTALEFEKHRLRKHGKVVQQYELHPESQIFKIEQDNILAHVRSN